VRAHALLPHKKVVCSFYGQDVGELRSVACRMVSDSVTCHPTEVGELRPP